MTKVQGWANCGPNAALKAKICGPQGTFQLKYEPFLKQYQEKIL